MTDRPTTIYPDCMMPDGAEPCAGYQQMEQRAKDAEARLAFAVDGKHALKTERDRYRAALKAIEKICNEQDEWCPYIDRIEDEVEKALGGEE